LPYSLDYIKKLQENFVHLHVHSEYSNIRILDSINKLKDMINYVASLGQNSLAITDHECLSSHIKFLTIVENLKKEKKINNDFKAILGNEIYLVDKNQMEYEIENLGKTTFFHFLLLAKDNEGHEQLRKLSSLAWKRMFSYKGIERVPTFFSDFNDVLQNNKGHLIASSACLGGLFPRLVLTLLQEEDEDKQENIKEEIHRFITWCTDTFGEDDFYIEIQPSLQEEQVTFNKMAIKIAKAYGLKWIITTDAHYLQPKDREIHKAFLTSEDDENNNREIDDFYSTTHFFTSEMILNNMSYLDNKDIEIGIFNTKEISDKIKGYNLFSDSVIPLTKLPDEKDWIKVDYDLNKYIYIKKMFESQEKQHKYLITQIFKGIKERNINNQDLDEVLERINIECKEILGASEAKKQPMGAYLITMQKNVDIIWEEAESIVGAGRGSANGYIIDYLLGITQVNPLKQGVEMPHWRFMSAERPDIFDIDIDFSSHKKDIVFDKISKYYQSIGGDAVRVATFGTETSKSAIQTACRGLKINSDVALYLSSLVPIERGKVWSISDCFYGNETEGRKPVTEFRNMVSEYADKKLLNVMLGIEGLINKRSSHACGILIENEKFTKHNSFMRTPSGELISAYELHDSEKVSNLKYDFLNTKTCSMIQLTLEMLLKSNKIQWQGSLRKTYNKYLHPDVIDRDTKEMWNILCRGELLSAFQFESNVGEQAIKLIQPQNIIDAANGNTVMRLMVDNGEQPLEKFVRYKNDISEWYKDMKSFGLKDEQIKILEKHLLQDYGVCSSQERMMLLTMDDNISGFGVIESNKLRKGCAKKLPKDIAEAKELFFKWGKEKGTPQILLNYIWDEQIYMQLGYGFSILHAIAYTIILIQQLNLVYYYPPIYWNTAVLLVESGAVEREVAEDLDIETKEKTTNYGEVAKAIGNLQSRGIKISLPYINKAEQGFMPNEENNEIVFGLKGIMGINNETSQLIMEMRPFKNLKDFHERMVLVKKEVILSTGKKQMKSLVSATQTITLIKTGAFDKLEHKDRELILEEYLKLLNPPKNKLNTKDISKMSELGILPIEFKNELRFYNFRDYLLGMDKRQDENLKTATWYKIYDSENEEMTEYATNFFIEHFSNEMEEGKDYIYDDNGYISIILGTKRKGSFDSIYSEKIKKLTAWLTTDECINSYNYITFENIKNEEMRGNISSWEMESMNFYYHEHELKNINKDKYGVIDFNCLSEEPEIIGFTKYKGLQYPKFKLDRIVGTVLDRDKNKHSVTILTPGGVVVLKFYSGQFAFYDKTISKDNGIDDKGKAKKIILEDGWFKRGNLLLVTGFRRGDQFKPKRYKDSIYQHAISKITEIKENGDLLLQNDRIQEV
jgi:DNA polymerase-3 subunit alpha